MASGDQREECGREDPSICSTGTWSRIHVSQRCKGQPDFGSAARRTSGVRVLIQEADDFPTCARRRKRVRRNRRRAINLPANEQQRRRWLVWLGRQRPAQQVRVVQPETYEAIVAGKTATPNAMKKLMANAWCARQIIWPNRTILGISSRRASTRRRSRKFSATIQSASSNVMFIRRIST